MITWAPCMQWLVVPTPRRPLSDLSRTSSAPRHFGRWPGKVKYSQTVGRGAVISNSIACTEMQHLDLKFVSHHGEFITHRQAMDINPVTQGFIRQREPIDIIGELH